MPKYKMFVFSDVAPGADEAEYNAWYDGVHIPDVLRVDGFTGAQRFRRTTEGPAEYVAIYELEADDPARALERLGAKAGTPDMMISPSFDMATARIMIYEQVTEPFTA